MAGQHNTEERIEVSHLSSCALGEISGLCNFAGRPEDAMRSFHKAVGDFQQVCLMVFHGVVDAPAAERNDTGWCRGCQYCQEFVAFIRSHSFGEVVEGVKAENKRYHPGHIVQTFTWAPDYPAIKAWMTEVPTRTSVILPEKPSTTKRKG